MRQEGHQDVVRVLVADDEPDIFAVTKLSLKGLKFLGHKVELVAASSGRETVELMRAHPDTAVLLLDVVMERDGAGLEACRAIRGELGNPFVRILLRTGQPGVAPERHVIDEYDIDGYLPKAEMTASKLYTHVRTAIKAYTELRELDRHRRALAAVDECAAGLRSFQPLDQTLRQILSAVVAVCPAPLAVLHLETFDEQGNPQRLNDFLSTEGDVLAAEVEAERVQGHVRRARAGGGQSAAGPFEGGYLVPFELHHELGHGWLYVARAEPDDLARKMLGMLAAHAQNALYSSVAQRMLEARQGPIFDVMSI